MNPISTKRFLILVLSFYPIINLLVLRLSRDRVHALPSVFWETLQVLTFSIQAMNKTKYVSKKNFR